MASTAARAERAAEANNALLTQAQLLCNRLQLQVERPANVKDAEIMRTVWIEYAVAVIAAGLAALENVPEPVHATKRKAA